MDLRSIGAGAVAGFVGGLCAVLVAGRPPAVGVPSVATPSSATPQGGTTQNLRAGVVRASSIQLVDASGKVRATLAMSGDGRAGGPGLFFFDRRGVAALELGLYPPAEDELPFVVLNDAKQEAAGIFRLFGGQRTPVVVLKHDGRDRSIFGLNPGTTEPFLVEYGNDGAKVTTFGNF